MIIDIHTHLFSKDIPYAGWWEIVARWSATQSGKTIEEVMEKKEVSKPNRGIIVHKESCINQKGEVLVEAMLTHLMKRRPKE